MKLRQLDKIKSLKPKDRLDRVEAIVLMDQHILGSCQEWLQWIANPTVINRFNEKELDDIYEQFKEIASKFIEFDLNTAKKLNSLFKDEDKLSGKPLYI
jgi:hypothetical protein